MTPASPAPSREVSPPAAEQSPSPAPVSVSYLSVTFTTPSALDGTASEAAELPDDILQSAVLSNCEVYLYLQNGDTESAVYAQVRADGRQYDWQLSGRYVSGGYQLIPLDGLFGFDAFAVKQGVFYYYYRAWDGTDDHCPELLFYRESAPTMYDVDSDGQPELIIPLGNSNEYTLVFLSAGGDVCRLSLQTDRSVTDWTGLLTDDTFLRTLKGTGAFSIADCVRLAPQEDCALSVSYTQNTLRLLSEESGEAVGLLSRQSAPHHDPSIEQGRIYFENGEIVRFYDADDHTSHQDFEPLDGCAVPATLARSTYAPPWEEEPTGTSWVVCFAREEGYMALYLSLDGELFTREEVIEIAQSIRFAENAFLAP